MPDRAAQQAARARAQAAAQEKKRAKAEAAAKAKADKEAKAAAAAAAKAQKALEARAIKEAAAKSKLESKIENDEREHQQRLEIIAAQTGKVAAVNISKNMAGVITAKPPEEVSSMLPALIPLVIVAILGLGLILFLRRKR